MGKKLKTVSGQLNKKNSEKGMSLIEALVSTVIISIGFIAVFQMVSYSIQSIDVSNERTKTSYLTGMVAEDLIADKFADLSGKKLYEHMAGNRPTTGDRNSWEMISCSSGSALSSSTTNVLDQKINKWNNRFSTRRIKCDPNAPNKKSFKIFDICKSGCDYVNDDIHDKIYFGKIQVSIKAGDRIKTKFLYFQIH